MAARYQHANTNGVRWRDAPTERLHWTLHERAAPLPHSFLQSLFTRPMLMPVTRNGPSTWPPPFVSASPDGRHQVLSLVLKLHRRLKKSREKSSSSSQLDAQRSSPALSSGDEIDFVSSKTVTEDTTRTLEPARSPRNTQR